MILTRDEAEIRLLSTQYFHDMDRDNRIDSDDEMRSWLWFTCPALYRTEVRAAIEELRKERAGRA